MSTICGLRIIVVKNETAKLSKTHAVRIDRGHFDKTMTLTEYLQDHQGKYDKVYQQLKDSRDIASGQTHYKNLLRDLVEVVNSGVTVLIGVSKIDNLQDLDIFFAEHLLHWQGLEEELSNRMSQTIDYGAVD
ncbi:MAG: hypothetical protein AAFQ94_22355 [Bacteroidota bacterium]